MSLLRPLETTILLQHSHLSAIKSTALVEKGSTNENVSKHVHRALGEPVGRNKWNNFYLSEANRTPEEIVT